MIRSTALLYVSLVTLFINPASFAADMKDGPSGHATVGPHPPLVQAVSSFGAAVLGEELYVYGGHIGRAHQHSIENLDPTFRRLDLIGGGGWQDLGEVPGLQGLALVSHGNSVYRVGGLSARNHKGDEEDLHSIAGVARYSPTTGAWESLVPLPEPRSSHDAVVFDGKLYVMGGWRLAGTGAEGQWHHTAHVLDLEAEEGGWQSLPEPPFTSRALAVAAAAGKVYALGGLTRNGTSNAVFVYDVVSQAWSEGPDLPFFKSRLKGFGASAFGVAERVYISSMDGVLFRLSEDGSAWERTDAEISVPRFFHRMVPEAGGQRLLLIGGASRDGHLKDIETIDLASLSAVVKPALAQDATTMVDPNRQWAGFRGRGDGHTQAVDLPIHWSETENLAWSIDLPGYGQSSPVVWGRQAFVTSAVGPMKEVLVVSAIDLNDGSLVWRRRFPTSQKIASAEHMSRSAPTPAVDAERLYVFFESGDLFALDHDGNDLWRRSLSREYGELKGNHGLASSPVLTRDAAVVLVNHEGPSYLIALDKETGENLYKLDRPDKVSWSSPVVSSHDRAEEILVSAQGTLEAFDAKTGDRKWFVDGIEKNHISSPTVASDLVIIGSSENGHSQAVRRGGQGNVTETHVVWHAEDGASSFGSPLVHGGCAYFVNRAGALRCVDIENGQTRWSMRLADSCWASPIVSGNRVYFFSKNGTTTVLESDAQEPRKLSEATLAGEGNVYGVAAVDGAFLIRTGTKLIQVGRGRGEMTVDGGAES